MATPGSPSAGPATAGGQAGPSSGSGGDGQEPRPAPAPLPALTPRPGPALTPADAVLATLARAIAPSSLSDVGFRIPWNQRLSTKLLGLTAVVMLGIVGAFAFAELAVQRHLFRQAVDEADLLVSTLTRALHRAMLQDRRYEAHLVMEDVGKQPGIESIRLIGWDGRVDFSTERAEMGRRLDPRSAPCAPCHAGMPPRAGTTSLDRSRVYQGDGHRVLAMVSPIQNESSCSNGACHAHPPDRKVLGIVDVGLSLERLDQETMIFRWRILFAAAAATAILGLVFWLFIRSRLLRPVAALVQATRRVARDQLDLEIPVTWDGELGVLAASFNDMTRSLRASERQLEALNENLERQVEDRTAALRMAQEQLVRTEKLSSLGKLSASIAHEINNPLAGILTFAKLISRTLDQGSPDEPTRRTLVRNLALVERETDRCSAIVRNLLDFARERPLALKPVSLHAVLEEAVSLLANQMSIQGVALEKRLGDVPHVSGDFGQLRQALVNVILNACEAIQHGGRITVETGTADEGRLVEMAIQDSGPGIAPEHLQKIFDPFFTTKERGTGLGLSVVYGIVERHGGKIEIHSQVGQGTRVTIRLPALRPEAAGA
jgi:two-component system NtrC family sensor kinase